MTDFVSTGSACGHSVVLVTNIRYATMVMIMMRVITMMNCFRQHKSNHRKASEILRVAASIILNLTMTTIPPTADKNRVKGSVTLKIFLH